MVLARILLYLSTLSLTSLLVLAAAAALLFTLRRKGYGVDVHLGSIEITALRGSRRFPDGARVRVATRFAHFLLSGCRGPWLDLSTARFVMRLRAAPRASAPAASSALRRSFARLSAALAVDAAYWRVIAHNLAVAAGVFFLRGVRLRAERVHVWRRDAHWAFKADQFVYTGHAVGLFGSRYDVSVNELSLLSDRYPVGVTPPLEPDGSDAESGVSEVGGGGGGGGGGDGGGRHLNAGPDASFEDDPAAALAAALAAAAVAAQAEDGETRSSSHRAASAANRTQPPLTPHSSSAAITPFGVPCSPAPAPQSSSSRPPRSPSPAPPPPPPPSAPAAALPAPLRVSLVLRKGVHLSARLAPRLLTVFRPRRMAIMDDVTLTLDVRDVSAKASHVATLRLESAVITLCPGYSRSLRAKLPPSAPSTRRPRKPGLLRYWEASGSFTGLDARLVPPPMPTAPYSYGASAVNSSAKPSSSGSEPEASHCEASPEPPLTREPSAPSSVVRGGGLFAKVKSASFEACGMAADERQEAMSKASMTIDHVFAGSVAIETSAQEHCKTLAQFAPPQAPSPRATARDRRKSRSLRSKNLRWMDREREDGNGGGSEAERGAPDCDVGGDDSKSDCEGETGDHVPPPLDPAAVHAIEALLRAQPEAVVWLAGIRSSFDMNCAKRDAVRCDVGGDGGVLAIEPAGLLRIARDAFAFARGYTITSEEEALAAYMPSDPSSPLAEGRESPPGFSDCELRSMASGSLDQGPLLGASQAASASTDSGGSARMFGGRSRSGDLHRGLSRSTSMSSLGSDSADTGERGALMIGCDLKRCHAIVLGDSTVAKGDTLALIFGAEKVTIPRVIRSGLKNGGFRLVCEVENLRVDHWSQWARTANLVCEHGAFSNISKSSDDRREVNVFGLSVDWDLDLQSALEELPERFKKLARVSRDPELTEYTRALCLRAIAWDSSPTATATPAGFLSPTSSTASLPARKLSRSSSGPDGVYPAITMSPSGAARFDADAAALAEVEKRERRERRRRRFLQILNSWMLSGTDVCVAASFPDGPRMSAHAAEVPSFHLSDERYVVRHVVVDLSGTRCMYAEEFSVRNPIHSMGRLSDRQHVDITVKTFRALMADEYWFGLLLQDWLVRIKAVMKVSREARYRRKGLPMPRYRKKPFPDMHVHVTDIQIAVADHPIDEFLTRALPLMQDEAMEREKRYRALGRSVVKMQQTNSISKQCIRQLKQALAEEDSAIYIRRMKSHMGSVRRWDVAPGFLPGLRGPPQSLFTAATMRFEMLMDEATRKVGSAESIRKLKLFDTYLLGPQKHKKTRQYESSAWNSLGFRDLVFDATMCELRFRDFPAPFMTVDHLYFDKGAVVGQGQEGMMAPYLTEATVAIGRRRVVKIVKSVASTKTFGDVHLIADKMHVTYNPAYIGSVSQFSRATSRFLGGGKNPSPRMAWFDQVRAQQHGQFRITARVFTGIMTSSESPYTITNHYVNIVADDVSMLMTRRPPTARNPDPISWEVHNWRFYPSLFREDVRSAIAFKLVKVGLNPVPESFSGDPQDHYVLPLVTKEEVLAGGPGIGRAEMTPSRVDNPVSVELNETGCYTLWTSPLLTDGNPSYDSYTDFYSHSIHLGIRIDITHAPGVCRPGSNASGETSALVPPDRFEDPPAFWGPDGASIVHSDAITTLRKVIGRITHHPISNKSPTRWNFPGRKEPNMSGLGHRMVSMDLSVNVRDLNVMVYNNFEMGHGLFAGAKSICGGMSKAYVRLPCDKEGTLGGYVKEAKVVRQSAELDDFVVAMRIPGLDFADAMTECGSLFSFKSLRLSRLDADAEKMTSSAFSGVSGHSRENRETREVPEDHGYERVTSEGFGDVNEQSPFYTFSANHALQRGKEIDKVTYKQVLRIDGVRIFWSPLRRNSLLSWSYAFSTKQFAMKGVGVPDPAAFDPLHEEVDVEQRIEKIESIDEALAAKDGVLARSDPGEFTPRSEGVSDEGKMKLPRPGRLGNHDRSEALPLGRSLVHGRESGSLVAFGSDSETFSVDNDYERSGPGVDVVSNSASELPFASKSASADSQSSTTMDASSGRRRRRARAKRGKAVTPQPDASRNSGVLSDVPITSSIPSASGHTRTLALKKAEGDLIDLIEPQLVDDVSPRVSKKAQKWASPKNAIADPVLFPDEDRNMRSLPQEYLQDNHVNEQAENHGSLKPSALATSLRSVLETNAKFQLQVTDSQICFGSPDVDSLVILTSESASIGLVDKIVEQKHQLGSTSEKWIDAEHRVLLQRSRVYVLSESVNSFRFHERWVPREADTLKNESEIAQAIAPLTRVTVEPISFNVMYIRAKSIAKDDDDDVDNVLRPAQLYINVPYVSMDSTRAGFVAVTDVVRKVLMLRVPNSEIIKDELDQLRYNMQLAGGQLTVKELEDHGRRLQNITQQFLYARETFQHHLVSAWIRPEDGDFATNFLRYKARAKAIATYMRSEKRASGTAQLFPTMYISYSFDQCSWQLRDFKSNKPFVEIVMKDLVCRHIFYVGRGMSSEFSFKNINAINHQEGGFYKGILHPSESAGMHANMSASKIKASDGTSVAFRWFTIQMESVGGIPVYDLLTINLSPLNAAISNSLSKAVFEFAFGTTDVRKIVSKAKGAGPDAQANPAGSASSHSDRYVSRDPSRGGSVPEGLDTLDSNPESAFARRLNSAGIPGSDGGKLRPSGSIGQDGSETSLSTMPVARRSGHFRRRRGGSDQRSKAAAVATEKSNGSIIGPLHTRTRSEDVQEMRQRGQSTMIFKYIYIGEFQLTASYKQKEDPDQHSFLDITDLTVNSPSYMYSSQIWTWRDFAQQMKKELLVSFAVRGVSNLAKLKLLPGYQRVRRRVKQGTDTVSGLRHGIFDRSSGQSLPDVDGNYLDEYEGSERGARTDSMGTNSDDDSGDHDRGIVTSNELVSPHVQDDENRRRLVLQTLFGSRREARTSGTQDGLSSATVEGGRTSTSWDATDIVANVSGGRPPPNPRQPMRPKGMRASFLSRKGRE